MPTYTYKCDACEHVFEDFLSMSDCQKPESEPCPECKVTGKVQRYFADVPPLVSGVLGVTHRIPQDYRYIHNRVRKANRGSTMPNL